MYVGASSRTQMAPKQSFPHTHTQFTEENRNVLFEDCIGLAVYPDYKCAELTRPMYHTEYWLSPGDGTYCLLKKSHPTVVKSPHKLCISETDLALLADARHGRTQRAP